VLAGDPFGSILKQTSRSPTSRLVLAFFPLADPAAERALRRATKLGHPASLIGEGPPHGRLKSQYSNLRLKSEQLFIAEAPAATVQSLVEQIRREQPVSIFVIPAVFTNPSTPTSDAAGDAEWAQEAARAKAPAEPSLARLIQAKLTAVESDFEKASADLIAGATLGHVPGPTANWILENAYLVQSEAEEGRRVLEGPKPRTDPRANYAQVHALAHSLLQHHEHEVTEEAIHDALQGFQSVRELTTAELWSFPQMVRIALLEELSRLASDAAGAQQRREAAYLWADRLIASAGQGEETRSQILQLMGQEPYARSGAFLAGLAELLQGEEEILAALQRTELGGLPLSEIVRAENAQEASRSLAAARAFGSLRGLASLDTREVMERLSVVDEELRHDPSGTYMASDFETRDRCRQAVERISLWSGISERAVARMAVRLTQDELEPSRRHVPYFLVAEGIATLELRAGARLPLRVRVVRAARLHSVFLYFTSVLALTGSLDAVALELARFAGLRSAWMLSILGGLALFPLSELAIQMVHAIIIAMFPPSKLPKMDFESGIPDSCSTLVVVPMMLVNQAEIRKEVEKLEVRYLANQNLNLSFALFSDFLDAHERSVPGDAALLDTVRKGIADLNTRYPRGNFLLFHRPREWSASEQCWIWR